ncbi:hypothetical protein PITC_068190 [Penicillium italicum]|uniref:Uncharacterized protein n=1 Tax=Penicillium italicum TaxID=40296 RepID=A0A0A2LGM2_PENIT|nr:hypothetical protein PITC_068190 [Penicillium italicum]
MARPVMACPRDSGAATVAYTPLAVPENAPSQTQDELGVAERERSLWARLGTYHILVLGLGSIVLIIAVIPLAWLWTESMATATGKEPSSAWFAVIEANWTTRIVTICTAILRAVVTAQASVATAMFGGVILERVGAPLLDGPFYSSVRALSGSPFSLLWTPSLPLRKTALSILVVVLIVLEVLVTTAAQFLSTLLVADFGNGAFSYSDSMDGIRDRDGVYSKDTVPVLEMADQMKDEEIERWVKREERAGELYSVALDEGDGRVALSVKRSD